MSARRYEVRDQVWIDASPERAFAVASDPAVVPRYATEVRRIDVISRDLCKGTADVRSHLSMLGLTFPFGYRYRYRPGRYYGGVQQRGRLVRGYFTMRFRVGVDASGEKTGTNVEHVEGLISRVPGVTRLVGWLYFRVLSRGGIAAELARLKQIVETRECVAYRTPAGAIRGGTGESAG